MDTDVDLASSARAGWGVPRLRAGGFGAAVLLLVAMPCFLTLPWSLHKYDDQRLNDPKVVTLSPPTWHDPMGTDGLGRSILWRCLLGGAISLGIGMSSAAVAVAIGVIWGATAGFAGGRTDALMMRTVDVLFGLPSILLVVLVKLAVEPTVFKALKTLFSQDAATHIKDIVTLLVAIGGLSWLTMSRVIRGQVLSLRAQPFIEAARACGIGPVRIFTAHLLPNLIGPIVVYTTLTVPSAILSESFLSFLGIGVQPPMPSWGNLAADGVTELAALGLAGVTFRWWLIVWPCALLGMTLLALNFLGDALRDRLDPRRRV
ncbi:MAG: ABC transporter permease [Planctomycetes bacterium]|nr:ABC transporter permease [Planctomycetota bacterium]